MKPHMVLENPLGYPYRCGILNEANKNTLYWSIPHGYIGSGEWMDDVWWVATKNEFGYISCKDEVVRMKNNSITRPRLKT